MKCKSKNYVYNYNIKLIKENSQLKKKATFKYIFLFYLF